MKKIYMIILITLIFIMILTTCMSLQAEENIILSEKKPVLDIIKEQEEINILETIPCHKSLLQYDFSDDQILKFYFCPSFWSSVGDNIETLLTKAEIDHVFGEGYVILDDIPVLICELKKGNTTNLILVEEYDDMLPTYIKDIVNSSIYESELYENGTNYSKVICFNASRSRSGVIVYYIHEKNTIVRYYEHEYASGVDFTLSDFQTYGTAYYKYITSYEYNYDEDGDPISGGMTLIKFIEDPPAISDNNTQTSIWKIILIIASVVIVLCVIVISILYLKRKRSYT